MPEAGFDALVERVARAREDKAEKGNAGKDESAKARVPARCIVAIAGAPGSGKSTLAESLAAAFEDAVVMPMDGFHLDDSLLEPAGLRPVKGAPETFDAGGLVVMLARVADDDDIVYLPVFDRSQELSRAAAAAIRPSDRLVIVEGNYLLLDRPAWRELGASFDLTVLLDVPEPVLRERLVRRWLDNGYERLEAERKAAANDLPNGELVRSASRPADVLFVTG